MKIIPIAAVPSQTFNIVLAGQNCAVALYQKAGDVYIDISVSNRPIVSCARCADRVKVVQHEYLGFIGDIAFADMQGSNDPEYSGFGTRYKLIYLEAADL